MITVEKKEQIRRAYHVEGKSIRQIQREPGHHRDTIRKTLGDSLVPQYTLQKPRPSPVMDPVKPIIDQWLAEDEHRPRKQRHTARRIYDRLRTEYGFEGGESTVRRYVGQHRKRRLSQVFIPLAYEQGQIAQVDFGEGQVVIAGERVTAQLFCLRMGYSKQPFVTALPNQAQEAFFEGHVRAFDFLGGYTRNRQVSDVRPLRLDRNDCLGYASFTQRERGKPVVLTTVFPRFSVIGLHGAQAGNDPHCWSSSSGLAD